MPLNFDTVADVVVVAAASFGVEYSEDEPADSATSPTFSSQYPQRQCWTSFANSTQQDIVGRANRLMRSFMVVYRDSMVAVSETWEPPCPSCSLELVQFRSAEARQTSATHRDVLHKDRYCPIRKRKGCP